MTLVFVKRVCLILLLLAFLVQESLCSSFSLIIMHLLLLVANIQSMPLTTWHKISMLVGFNLAKYQMPLQNYSEGKKLCLQTSYCQEGQPRQRNRRPQCYFRDGKRICGEEAVRARQADRQRVERARQRLPNERPNFYIPRLQSDDPFIIRQV